MRNASILYLLFLISFVALLKIFLLRSSLSSLDIGGRNPKNANVSSTATSSTSSSIDPSVPPSAGVDNFQVPPPNKKPARQKLIMHIGPLKTGTTTIQGASEINKGILQNDNYEYSTINLRAARKQFQRCMIEQNEESCVKLKKNFHQALNYGDATDVGVNSTVGELKNDNITLLHSFELWSKLPGNNFAFDNMKTLLEPWDVHFVITYRPFLDWLPSVNNQYRKFTIYNGRYQWDETYTVNQEISTDNKVPLFTDYINRTMATYEHQQNTANLNNYFHDILHTYEVYHDFLKYINIDNPQKRIHIIQMYSSSSSSSTTTTAAASKNEGNTILTSFFCDLLKAKKVCEKIMTMKKEVHSNRSSDYAQYLDLDLIVREAKNQGLINIPRHEAYTLLQTLLKQNHIDPISDLPRICPNKEMEEWIWNRAVVSEEMFGETTTMDKTEDMKATIVKGIRKKFDDLLEKKKFCSVNATAALEDEKVRNLILTCAFQGGKHLIGNNLKEKNDINPWWNKLNCTE